MAPLAINNPSPLALLRGDRGFTTMGGASAITPAEAYTLNLAKLIPGDTIALYTLLSQLSVPKDWSDYHIVPFLCCLQLVVFRYLATKPKGGAPRMGLVLLSLVTFICWIYSQGDWFWVWQANDFGHYLFNAALLTLAFVAPLFVGKRN